MANTLTAIMPKILARGLMTLRERCIMPRLVNGDYSTEAAQKGTTIDVPIPTAVTTTNVAPAEVPIAGVATVTSTVQVSLSNWKQNQPIYLTDKELCDIDRNAHYLPMQLAEAVRALARDVNQSIFAKYKGTTRGVFGACGTGGVTPFGSGVTVLSATDARKVLNRQVCPKDSRRAVLDWDAEAMALSLSQFSDAEKIMSADVKIEGEIGKKFGIDWFADDDVPTHTSGTCKTLVGTLVINNAALGATSIILTSNSASDDAKTIVQGDILTIAGDTQKYVVIGAGPYTLSGSTGAQTVTISIYPGLRFDPAGTEACTIALSHVVNLVFHRDAFAFATRPLVQATVDLELGSKILSMQDAQTGLVLRLEVSRQHKQVAWEFDILWGTELVRPEMAMRILG